MSPRPLNQMALEGENVTNIIRWDSEMAWSGEGSPPPQKPEGLMPGDIIVDSWTDRSNPRKMVHGGRPGSHGSLSSEYSTVSVPGAWTKFRQAVKDRMTSKDNTKLNPDDQFTTHPNWWSRVREPFREYAAEFLGTMIFLIFGNGVNCQAVLSNNTNVVSTPHGDWTTVAFGWSAAVAIGVWACGGISGGHINPAVTLALATWRGFPWRKVPGYIFAQVFGAFIGSAIIYADYFHAINLYEGGRHIRTLATADLFAAYPLPYMTAASCFFEQFMATAILLIAILALNDKRNVPPPSGTAPIALFILVLGIAVCFGMQTGFPVNPARDLGPRIMTSMVGYGTQVFKFRNQYWLWCNIFGTSLGAQAGCFVYDALLFTGDESPLNKPDAAARRRHRRARREQRERPPAGAGPDVLGRV